MNFPRPTLSLMSNSHTSYFLSKLPPKEVSSAIREIRATKWTADSCMFLKILIIMCTCMYIKLFEWLFLCNMYPAQQSFEDLKINITNLTTISHHLPVSENSPFYLPNLLPKYIPLNLIKFGYDLPSPSILWKKFLLMTKATSTWRAG